MADESPADPSAGNGQVHRTCFAPIVNVSYCTMCCSRWAR